MISHFSLEKCYLSKPLSFVQRKALAKFRLGVLQIRIETGRYERPKKSPLERICKQCDLNVPEDENHFLLHCPKHRIMRESYFEKINLDGFFTLHDIDKLRYLVNSPDIVKSTAQFILDCYDNRTIEWQNCTMAISVGTFHSAVCSNIPCHIAFKGIWAIRRGTSFVLWHCGRTTALFSYHLLAHSYSAVCINIPCHIDLRVIWAIRRGTNIVLWQLW